MNKPDMNKTDKLYLFIFAAVFVSVLFSGIFSNICYGDIKNENLSLKNIYTSKSKDSYLIWFKFNRKPEGIIKKLGLNGYSLELAFKNAQSGIGSKFIKFHNRLFKAVEVIPVKNSGLNAMIYFRKNIKINKKDVYATFYGSYFIIKINHVFPVNLFENVGKKSPAPQAAPHIKSNNNAKAQKSKTKQAADPAVSTADPLKTSKNKRLFLSKHVPKLNMGFEVIKTTVYLSLIIGLIYAVYFLMNKFKNRVSVKEKLNNLKIASSINLGNKKSILLIEVNKEFFLVGVSPSNIQVIGHIKDNPGNIENALSKVAGDAGINAAINANANTYAEAAYQQTPSPAIMPYGKFADAMREQVDNYAGAGGPSLKIRAEQIRDTRDTNIIDKPDTFKVKNLKEVKFKSKADNVFFDIEERLKGLMESNGTNKKF